MSQSFAKNRPSTSVNRKSFNPRDQDDSPNFTTQNSPRTSNASFYGTQSLNTAASSGNVKVVCRVRPFNQREVELNGALCVDCEDEKTISIKTQQYVDGGSGALSFTFDRVFDMEASQEEVYEFAAKPVVESVLEGFNGTVFAYGQTSSGKTYTMMGPDIDEGHLCGVIPRMVATVFDYISETPDHIEFTVKVSIIEIYMERIRDLLNPKKVNLKVREDKTRGIYIEDVTESYVSDEKDVYDFLKYGHSNRATTTTNMNESSSRSHCIFMMTIHQNNLLEMSAKTGKLYLVDLAGSEKVAKTGAIGQVLEEAKEINKSLSALGNVINALTDNRGHQHIPYRDSKLTRILQESLGGNSRTSLIINCSPSSFNENETISALRFGYRAKSIKNTPKINREFTAAQLQVLLEKAEKKIVIRDKKIRSLEGLLADHGIATPSDMGDIQGWEHQTPNRRSAYKNSDDYMDEGDDTLNAYCERGDESISKLDMMSPERISIGNQYERIKALENELRIERLSLGKQTEKVKLLKKDLAENNTKMMMIEKENEALINKLATMTLKTQELEEKFRDKEMKLEILQLLKDVLMTENEELKKSRQLFLNDLDEENNEIMRIAQKQGLIPAGPGKNISQKEKDVANSAIMQEVNKNKESYFALVDELVKEMVREMTQKFGIRNIQIFRDMTVPYVDKLKEAFQVQNELTFRRSRSGINENSDDMRRKYEKLKEELALEKQKTTQIKNDYEKVIKEYDNLVKNNIPSFEEWKQGIIDNTPIEESIDIKDDTLIFKEFSNRNSKESKFGGNSDSMKAQKKLEAQIETALGIEHYIAATPQGTTPSGGDKKSPVKTQRMINLEKQLHETKELVNQYKNKIESLKSLITTNPSSTTSGKTEEPERYENTDTFKHHKQIIKQEVLDQVSSRKSMGGLGAQELSPRSAANAKIVKPIKGGQNKKPTTANNTGYIDVIKQQYRYNRSVVNSIGEGVLNKQKQGTSVHGHKNSIDGRPKFG